ncbi:MAG TPA: cysteine hydrolase [Acidimicrobiia bacterium]|nr:cysteine hydrolase [Acidimicrobiia bacterium]
MPLDLVELVAPGHTALVLQEVQNGVVGEPSALPALAEAAAKVGLVEHCAELARAARTAAVPVVHCTAATRADRRGANRNARLFMAMQKKGSDSVAFTPGSRQVQPPDEIGVEPSDLVLARSHGLGPMHDTALDSTLRNLGVTTIVGVGVSLNIGMPNFAFDAVNRGYQFVMPTDAVAGVPADYAQAVLDNALNLVATLTTTAEIVAAWKS